MGQDETSTLKGVHFMCDLSVCSRRNSVCDKLSDLYGEQLAV